MLLNLSKNAKSSKIFLDPNLTSSHAAKNKKKLMQSKERPHVLFVAEKIYMKSLNKKKKLDFSKYRRYRKLIGSKVFKEISSKFHDLWFEELKMIFLIKDIKKSS